MRFLLTLPFIEGAGFTTYCKNLAAGLQAIGHDAVLLGGVNPRQWIAKTAIQDLECFTDVVWIQRGTESATQHIRRYIEAIDRIRPDVLLLTYSPPTSASLPFINRNILRMPIIHSIGHKEVMMTLAFPDWWDVALCVSPFVTTRAGEWVDSERLRTCPLGVPMPSFTMTEPQASREQADPIRIVWLGRVVLEAKRADRVVDIASSLRTAGVRFHWTVAGAGHYLAMLRRRVAEAGLSDAIHFTGHVGRGEAARILANADVLVMPSDYEGLPQAMLEAMSHGVVPVISRIPGSTDCVITTELQGFLCQNDSTSEFCRAIQRLAESPTLRWQMGLAARRRIEQEYSIPAFTQRVLDQVRVISMNREKRPESRRLTELSRWSRGSGVDSRIRHIAKRALAAGVWLTNRQSPGLGDGKSLPIM